MANKVEDQKEESQDKILLIDFRLNIYYQQQGINDYQTGDDGAGKFAVWCEDNGFDETDLECEFNTNPNDCIFIGFDPNFPLNPPIDDEEERNKKIFRIIKNIYEGKAQLFLDDFNLDVSEEDILETHSLYTKHIKTWQSKGNYTQLTDINALYLLTVSRKDQRMNLLLNIVDSYRRDIVAQILKDINESKDKADIDVIYHELNPEKQRLCKYIGSRSFLKQLNDALKQISIDKTKIDTYFDKKCENKLQKQNKKQNKKKERKCILDLEQIIRVYPDRIGPRFRPRNGRLIDDNLEMISKYIVASDKFVNKLINKETNKIGGVPCLIDFIILLEPTVSDDKPSIMDHDDDDDDDDDKSNQVQTNNNNEYKEDIIGDIIHDINATKCVMIQTKVASIIDEEEDIEVETPDQIARKCMQDGFHKLREKIKDKDETYPAFRRFNVIIDRRKYYKTVNDDKESVFGEFMKKEMRQKLLQISCFQSKIMHQIQSALHDDGKQKIVLSMVFFMFDSVSFSDFDVTSKDLRHVYLRSVVGLD